MAVDLPTVSYAGGASPYSLSWPDTSLSNCVFKSYKESPRRMLKRSMGLQVGRRLNNPRACNSRFPTEEILLAMHGQDGGVAAESPSNNLL